MQELRNLPSKNEPNFTRLNDVGGPWDAAPFAICLRFFHFCIRDASLLIFHCATAPALRVRERERINQLKAIEPY